MGWKDIFKKKSDQKDEILDPLKDLTLKNLKTGYYVDFDMKTYQVTGRNIYDWGGGDKTYEWQLQSSDEVIYLEQESDDEDHWSISRKIPFGKLGAGIRKHILENEDPPEEVLYESTPYYLEEMGGGHFLKDGLPPEKPLLKWDYVDDSGKHFLAIEQWGEEDFEASIGESVEEYQFSNILPGQR
jgi:hypothetical protein